ncbi:hypothetical protein GCM10023195_24450 [Actinoallomurus liliacearum]|uniref:Uncharacterized protein n=2 Tax=Actinoallomurus liliacearum TaxID=1080073 RepID=A0ABP8TI04_9ACTN
MIQMADDWKILESCTDGQGHSYGEPKDVQYKDGNGATQTVKRAECDNGCGTGRVSSEY